MSKARELLSLIENVFIKKLSKDSSLPEVRQALISGLTDYDKRLDKKSPNSHRLSLLFKAVDDFEAKAKKTDFFSALKAAFVFERGKFEIPEVTKIAKKLELI